MPIELQDYYSRAGTGDHGKYERLLVRTGKVVQCAELNEMQEIPIERMRRVSDVLFKDGAIIRDAQFVVNPDTGAATAESGALYLRGDVRGVPPATFTIPVVGTVHVGVYLNDIVVTEVEDPSLRDPAVDVRNYHAAGAARLRVDTSWGFEDDGQDGEFYPVYTVVDGVILSKAPPPQIDSVTQAIAEYDRTSAGGYYVDTGLLLSKLADLGGGEQVYSLSEGSARVNGNAVRLAHSSRIVYDTEEDLKEVLAEPHNADGGAERVDLNHGPVDSITLVQITAEAVVELTHGGYSGFADVLPDSPVVSIVAVNQAGVWNAGTGTFTGGTTYVQGTDYKLTADKVDWSLPGAEVATGSKYKVVFRYIKAAVPTDVDATGFTVDGAVPGTLINTTYKWCLPRIDRLCLLPTGELTWIKGVASDTAPIAPQVPSGLLGIASVFQTWDANRRILNDATRVVAMSQLEAMQTRLDTLAALLSDGMLQINAAINEPAAKKGIFTDPFLDNDMRDQGIAQNAAIVNGKLMLPIGAAINNPAGSDRVTLTYDLEVVLAQVKRSGFMLVNPYQAFAPVPAVAKLTPEVDFWTETQSTFTSDSTTRFTVSGHFVPGNSSVAWTTTSLSDTVVSSRTTQLEYLRQITVNFNLSGFGPNETLDQVLFDGIDVTPV